MAWVSWRLENRTETSCSCIFCSFSSLLGQTRQKAVAGEKHGLTLMLGSWLQLDLTSLEKGFVLGAILAGRTYDVILAV